MRRRSATQATDVPDDVLRAAASGDRAAFGRFYDCTASTAYLMARMVTDSDARAQRITEEAYLEIWTSGAHPPDALPAMAWLLDVIRRRASA